VKRAVDSTRMRSSSQTLIFFLLVAGFACSDSRDSEIEPVEMSAPERAYIEGYVETARRRLSADPDDLEALHLLGHALADLGESSSARSAFEQLAASGQASGDLRFEALGYDGMGRIAREVGQHGRAVREFERAVELASAHGDASLLLNIRGNLAYAQLQAGAPDKARPILESVLQEKRKLGPQHEIMIAATQLGALYAAAGELERAESLYLEARQIAEEIQNPRWLQATRNNLERLRRERAAKQVPAERRQ